MGQWRGIPRTVFLWWFQRSAGLRVGVGRTRNSPVRACTAGTTAAFLAVSTMSGNKVADLTNSISKNPLVQAETSSFELHWAISWLRGRCGNCNHPGLLEGAVSPLQQWRDRCSLRRGVCSDAISLPGHWWSLKCCCACFRNLRISEGDVTRKPVGAWITTDRSGYPLEIFLAVG